MKRRRGLARGIAARWSVKACVIIFVLLKLINME
jgi:hypothetical protein